MLSIKENFLETLKRGNPDRYVNQYEFVKLLMHPYWTATPPATPGGPPVVNPWGVTISFPEGMPGPFPIHDEEHIVVKDVTKWKDVVKAPATSYSEEDWAPFVEEMEAIDRNEFFVAPFVAPGIFEQTHYLLEIQNCLMAFYEEPEAMHELIAYITEFELAYAEDICKHLKPNALFHHDDWGTQKSTFLSPDMFNEFFLDPYKKVYQRYRDLGVELIIHHSDSYAATLVPSMIEMGIDIWQGVMSTNNVPELIEKYGDDIIFMGGIDSSKIDKPDWTAEETLKIVEDVCRAAGKRAFIPCNTMGGPESMYPGAYDAVTEAIKVVSKKMF